MRYGYSIRHHHGVAGLSSSKAVSTTLRQAERSAAHLYAVWRPKLSGLRSASSGLFIAKTGVDDLLGSANLGKMTDGSSQCSWMVLSRFCSGNMAEQL